MVLWIGAYDEEEAAARAYDLAALKYWGRDTLLNFPVIFLQIPYLMTLFLVKMSSLMIFVCCYTIFSPTSF